MDDHELAAHATRRAAELLVELRAAGASGADGDLRSNDVILELLAKERREDAVLSEESKDSAERLSAQRAKSRLSSVVASPLYKSMTIRSWSTTVKLLEILDARGPHEAG